MPTTVAQATIPTTGASNAADFQPETRNPQTAPGQLFDQSQELQSGSQSDLLDNNQTEIQVPKHPAPASQNPVTTSESGTNLLWLPLVLGLVAALLLYRRLRRRAVPAPEAPVEVAMPVEFAIEKPVAPRSVSVPPKPKKPSPKKSKSKRKKRARR